MDSQHDIMRRAAREIDITLDTIRDALQRLHWQGADRAAYNEAQKKWDDSVVDMNNVLNEIAMAVGYARENYATTEMSNSQLWSN
jgi:WXG100 family type VII secretion target